MKSIFSVGFGSLNREERLRTYLKEDYIVAVILSAAHFEWTLKRSILKLSKGPTIKLKRSLEETHRLFGPSDKNNLQAIWAKEVGKIYKNASLGTVLSNLAEIRDKSRKTRGYLVHGNGLSKRREAESAVTQYLLACHNLRNFVAKQGQDLDARLQGRIG